MTATGTVRPARSSRFAGVDGAVFYLVTDPAGLDRLDGARRAPYRGHQTVPRSVGDGVESLIAGIPEEAHVPAISPNSLVASPAPGPRRTPMAKARNRTPADFRTGRHFLGLRERTSAAASRRMPDGVSECP